MSADTAAPPLSVEISSYLDDVLAAHPDISQVWFIGSRANGSVDAKSDWDFFVFAGPSVLAALRTSTKFQRPDVDLLIVVDGDNFECPWPRLDHPGEVKSGHLFGRLETNGITSPGWRWRPRAPHHATYIGGKEIGQYKTFHAFRIFPKPQLP